MVTWYYLIFSQPIWYHIFVFDFSIDTALHFPEKLTISFILFLYGLFSLLSVLLFNFHTLQKFWFSDWLICTTWYWVVMKQPPWTIVVYWWWCGEFNTPVSLHHGFQADSKFDNNISLCSVFNLNKIKMSTHSLLMNYQDLPALVHQQWTWNF